MKRRGRSAAAAAGAPSTRTHGCGLQRQTGQVAPTRAYRTSELAGFFTLQENLKVRCRWPTVDGQPCRSNGFVGENVDMHFRAYHVRSLYRAVCALCGTSVGAANLRQHLGAMHAEMYSPEVMALKPFDKNGWKTLYTKSVCTTLQLRNQESDNTVVNIEEQLSRLWRVDWEPVPLGFRDWLAAERARRDADAMDDDDDDVDLPLVAQNGGGGGGGFGRGEVRPKRKAQSEKEPQRNRKKRRRTADDDDVESDDAEEEVEGDDEEGDDGDGSREEGVFELLGNGKVRCRCLLVDGRECGGLGFLPERVMDHFADCHPQSQYRVRCILCDTDVPPHRSVFNKHLLSAHPEHFATSHDWQNVYARLVRTLLEKRGESKAVVEREMRRMNAVAPVPKLYTRWLKEAQRLRGGEAHPENLALSFEYLSEGRFKCHRVLPVTGLECNARPFDRTTVSNHFSRYHPLSVYRTRCVMCSASLCDTGQLKRHLRTRVHHDVFTPEIMATTWADQYTTEAVRVLRADGRPEDEIERELNLLWEHEKVPAHFLKWAAFVEQQHLGKVKKEEKEEEVKEKEKKEKEKSGKKGKKGRRAK